MKNQKNLSGQLPEKEKKAWVKPELSSLPINYENNTGGDLGREGSVI